MSAILRASAVRAALRATPASRRTIVSLKERLYEVEGIADSAGRNGTVQSFGDAPLDLKMAMPKAAGGKGDGQNPEQLFAMGYACTLARLENFFSHADWPCSMLPWCLTAPSRPRQQDGDW